MFWRAADDKERVNGCLYRRYNIALPRELSLQQQVSLAEEFADHITAEHSLPWSLAIQSSPSNPYCRVMVNERINDGIARSPELWFNRYLPADPANGGAQKTRALAKKRRLYQIRQEWAEHANRALAAAGSAARIDHRSLAAQGIVRAPSGNIGIAVLAMERRGVRTERGSDPTLAPAALELVRAARRAAQTNTDGGG